MVLENSRFRRFGRKFSGEYPVSLLRGSPKIANFQNLFEITEQGKYKAAVIADSGGNFSAAGLLTGTYEVKVSALNYKDARFNTVNVVAGGATTNNAALSPDRQNLYADDFNDNSLSSSNFVVGLLPNGTAASEISVTENNQRLEISFQATNQPGIRYNGVRTAQTRNFNNSSVVVHVAERPESNGVTDPSGKATVSSRIEIGINDSTKYQVDILSGSVFPRKIIGGSTTNLVSFFFSPINTLYLRIRQGVSRSGVNTVFFESSPTGLDGTWKIEREDNYDLTQPFDFSNVYVSLNAGRNDRTCTSVCDVNPLAAFDDFRFVTHSEYVAKARDDKAVTVGTNVQLNGAATDQNGAAATASNYKWTLASKPFGAPDPTISAPSNQDTTVTNLSFAGDYNFQLTVGDGQGGYSSDTIRVRVVDAPVARISAPSTIMEDEPIVFDGTLSSGADEYEWDFGDGYKAEIPRATHVYMRPGTYNASLKIKSATGAVSSQTFFPVIVTQLPAAAATVNVPCGDVSALQTAINNAVGRTDIILPSSCQYTFTGSNGLTLPYKSSNDYIVIKSSQAGEFIEGRRVSKDNANDTAKMAFLNSALGNGTPIISTDLVSPANPFGVHHYRFEGIYFRRWQGTDVKNRIIRLGEDDNEEFLYQVPHHFVFNHCVIENAEGSAVRRGIELNASDFTIINSGIYNIRGNAGDSHAIGSWSTPGRHAIVNNHLEGGSENILYGGADTPLKNISPSDITIRGNNLIKPLAWRTLTNDNLPDYPNAKNLFEIKHAKNLILDGNNLENSWRGSDQAGYAILIRANNSDGANPWATAQNIQITNNRTYNTRAGIDVAGIYPSNAQTTGQSAIPMYNCIVRNNLFDKVGFIRNPDNNATEGILIHLITPGKRFIFDHNTFVNDLLSTDPPDTNPDDAKAILVEGITLNNNSDFRFTNNLLKVNGFGFRGESEFTPGTNGLAVLNAYVPDWIMRRNVFLLQTEDICGEFTSPVLCKNYPADNKYDLNSGNVNFQNQFANYASGNYQLVAGSLGYQYAADGTDVGCNFQQVLNAKDKAVGGNWSLP